MDANGFHDVAAELDELDETSTWVADTLEREAGESLAKHAAFDEFVLRRGD